MNSFLEQLAAYESLLQDYDRYYNGLTDAQKENLVDTNNQNAINYYATHDECVMRYTQLMAEKEHIFGLPGDGNGALKTNPLMRKQIFGWLERINVLTQDLTKLIDLLNQAARSSSVN